MAVNYNQKIQVDLLKNDTYVMKNVFLNTHQKSSSILNLDHKEELEELGFALAYAFDSPGFSDNSICTILAIVLTRSITTINLNLVVMDFSFGKINLSIGKLRLR